MKISRRTAIISGASVVVVAALVVTTIALTTQNHSTAAVSKPSASHSAAATPTPTATATTPPYVAPTAAQVAALPEAIYNAVIPGLFGYASEAVPAAATSAYTLKSDTAIFNQDRTTAVAKFDAKNFLGDDSVVVPVKFDGDWALVLTPSRVTLPSKNPDSPAQSAGWIGRDQLVMAHALTDHVVVAVGAQTVSIVDGAGKTLQSFSAGVGANKTPTPVGVVGYIQARYLDPAQNETVYPINLTSIHSSAADEPFGGKDGGLIGVHYEATHSGTVSHGCVRLAGAAITAINALPLGTPVVMVS